LKERLGIPENKAMKLLISTFFTLLLIGFAGGSYGQPDFEETKLLAEQGNAFAQVNLGLMYANGDGVPENDVEAVRWYRLAAEQGHAFAQHNLGLMYADGEGVPENDVEAVKWYRLAAEQGHAFAQNNLGLMYGNGRGVPENDVEAYVWFSVAAAQGHENARGNRDIVSERLTPDQRARGQEIAAKCFESDYQDCE
jgi:TPR repeat protein